MTTGIVLAGGRSSRFGGSKLDADLAGRTVLDRTIDAVVAACGEVIVVGSSARTTPGRSAKVRFLPDAAPFEGPLAGLVTGLEAARGDVAIVIGADMPLARPEVLRLLVAALDGPATAAVLEDGATPRPLPMAVRRDAALAAARAVMGEGERSLRAFLGQLPTAVLPEAVWRRLDEEGDTLLDIDAREDLERARARLGGRAD